ncbi:hypothetical protein BH11PLA2_BH11PLA2_06880 [soil metagenome]
MAGEVRINTTTANSQTAPAIATAPDGSYIAVWASVVSGSREIFAQRYTSSGVKIDVEARINNFTANDQTLPAIAIAGNGNYVITWQSSHVGGNGFDIVARRFFANGVARDPNEFVINTFVTGEQSTPSIAINLAGDFTIAWQSAGQDGSGLGVYARRYSADGVALDAAEFRANNTPTSDQSAPAIAMDALGNFVVAWQSAGQDGSGLGIYAQRYNSVGVSQTPPGGVPLGTGNEFRVNTTTAGGQGLPSVAMDADGDFVVAWQGNGSGDADGIFARKFTAAGQLFGSELAVNSVTADVQENPSVSMDADGDFVVVWDSYGQDGSYYGDYHKAYRNDNTPVTTTLPATAVNTTTAGNQMSPSVAMDADGEFIVVWTGNGPGDTEGIYGQRYTFPTPVALPIPPQESVSPATGFNLSLVPYFTSGSSTPTENLGYAVSVNTNAKMVKSAAVVTRSLNVVFNAGLYGQAEVIVRARDTTEDTSAGDLVVMTYLESPDAPLLDFIRDRTVDEGSTLTFTATATDPQGTAGQVYSLLGAPSGASMNATTGAFTWTPVDGPGATAAFSVKVTDPTGYYTQEEFTVTVANLAPTVTGFAPEQAVYTPGATAKFAFTGATDVSPADVSAGLLYSYDFDNDGTFETSKSTSATGSNVYIFPGVYVVRGRVEDKDGGFSDSTTSVTIGGFAPPLATAPVVNGGAVQRSRVTSLAVTFNSTVTLLPNAFTLTRAGGGTIPALNVSTQTVSGVTVATITFSGAGSEFGSVSDGLYTLTVNAGTVRDVPSSLLNTASQSYTFTRIYGDADGNRTINGSDLVSFGNAFSSIGSNLIFDADGNNTINGSDLVVFGNRFGTTL